jgi:two-component system, response regulator PdtaR
MGKKVLIVEDEIVAAMALERTLTNIGYQVIGTVASGEDAIVWADRESPDFIVMDIRLAGAIDGIDAAERIAEISGAAILFMTGYDDKDTKARAMALKPLGFLTKPIDGKKFGNILR